jgi:hypothetical protein
MNDQRNTGIGLSRRALLTKAGTAAAGIGAAAVGGSVAPVAARNREQSLARSGGAAGGKIMAISAVAPSTDGAYASFMGDEGEARVRAAYPPATYARLVEVKHRYDPGNLFRLNANVSPA